MVGLVGLMGAGGAIYALTSNRKQAEAQTQVQPQPQINQSHNTQYKKPVFYVGFMFIVWKVYLKIPSSSYHWLKSSQSQPAFPLNNVPYSSYYY